MESHPAGAGDSAYEAAGDVDRERATADLFSERFLIKRPLLQAIDESLEQPPVLLIDELDRADEEFEGFLLELLSDYQITIPELGTYRAANPPVVIITSNRTRGNSRRPGNAVACTTGSTTLIFRKSCKS